MTTNTTEEKAARAALIEENFVDCIIQLPDRLFFGTGIPACLWFLSKNRNGSASFRKRVNEILFIDARKKGVLVTRRQRVLTDDEIAEIAAVYHQYRLPVGRHGNKKGKPQDITGFCKTATLDDVRAHDYKLTPGIYVGTEQNNIDDTPFEEKMTELTAQLKSQFTESNALHEKIVKNLSGLTE